ncbi:unnamed protein product [Effrenium voratum]|uniref:Histone chaperone RTT106/FACT complex subunit SPT16-like middle domain-containing protein n=1 Tax=Effrenium voratum TaxID=2562239 RepID=A0AA36IA99_9DINO|nr:unnamed protein product [Effrenium voratum]
MDAAVAAQDAAKLAGLVKEQLGPTAALKLLQGSVNELTKEAPLVVAEVLVKLPSISVSMPRGRYDLLLTEKGLVFQGKTPLGLILWEDVVHLLKVPKQESNRKAGAPAKMYLLVLVLSQPVVVGKQEHRCIVLNANGTKAALAPALEPGGSGSQRHAKVAKVLEALSAEGQAEHEVLSQVLEAGRGIEKVEPAPSVCALEGIQAWKGVEEGVLYPLSVGLCFLPKPAIFMPAKDILHAEAGSGHGPRGGDLIIHRISNTTPHIFSNLAGADVTALLAYLSTLVAHHQSNGGGVPKHVSGEDDEEADPDYEVEGDQRPAKRRAVTRTAKQKPLLPPGRLLYSWRTWSHRAPGPLRRMSRRQIARTRMIQTLRPRRRSPRSKMMKISPLM